MFDLFVSEQLPEQVMSDVIREWLRDFSEKQGLYRSMGVQSLRIIPTIGGFRLEPEFAMDAVIEQTARKEAA